MYKSISFILFILSILSVNGYYVKTAEVNPIAEKADSKQVTDDWSNFKRKLRLSDAKVKLLKSQKDQRATINLLNRFIKENSKYITAPAKKPDPSAFLKSYNSIVKQLKRSKGTLKTSLNFELTDKPLKSLKRARRRIAVKMISDMPSEKIDDLLEIFNQQHGIRESDDFESDNQEESADYSEVDWPTPTPRDADYTYENLYEDEEDLAVPAKSNRNSEFGSFQDLIFNAQRNQWQRELEELKLAQR